MKLGHMSDPPLCGRERDVVRDLGRSQETWAGKNLEIIINSCWGLWEGGPERRRCWV